jgi:hypothetical protein
MPHKSSVVNAPLPAGPAGRGKVSGLGAFQLGETLLDGIELAF